MLRPRQRTTKGLVCVLLGWAAVVSAVAVAACVGENPITPLPKTPDAATDANQAQPDLCIEYCDGVLASCTGANRAFDNREQCLKMCAFIPQGREGDKTNSVACRLPHAKAGAGKETCANASAYGGGACGDRCDTFCDLVDKNCIQPGPPVPKPYGSKADCVEACGAMKYDAQGVEGPGQATAGDDTLNCRMYHLILSLGDQVGHCPHVAIQSATCKTRDAGSDGG